jgi:prepilin-type N-terminal cleavage/methylation domain-containing protein
MKRRKFKNDPPTSTRSNAGFSLIELLVVVAVILIIAAIAIPNYMKSKMRANEASAVQNLRNVATAELVYSTTYGVDFSSTLLQLSGNGINPDQNNAGLIDETLASGIKSGYVIAYLPITYDPAGNPSTYGVTADPQVSGTTGTRHYYTDQSCVIRWNDNAPAGPTDPPIN